MRKFLMVMALFMVGFFVSSAHAVDIDFTTIPAGTQISTQYLSQGVWFETFDPSGNTSYPGYGGAPAIGGFNWASVPGYPGLTNSPTGAYPTAEYLIINFTNAASNVSFTFDNWGNGNGTYYNAYDSGGVVVNTARLDGNPAYDDFFSVTVGSNVSYIWIDNVWSATYGSNWIFAVGNLSYTETGVPEPSTLLLLGSGLLGLVAFRKKFSA